MLTSPILTNKWGILYLFYLLGQADSRPPNGEYGKPASQSPQKHGGPTTIERNLRGSTITQTEVLNKVRGLEDASPARINQLPSRSFDGKQRTASAAVQARDVWPSSYPTINAKISSGLGTPTPKLPSQSPSEAMLLRDLPFSLQGLSTTNLPFATQTTLSLPSNLSLPLISLLHTLAEPSLLYRKIADFISARNEGLIGQSLRAAINDELRSYLGLIATLEGEIRRAVTALSDAQAGPATSKLGVTLKRCVVWTRDATMGLRLMSVMAEESKSRYIICSFANSINLCRHERWTADIDGTHFFNLPWRSICECFCGANVITLDTTILRHVTTMGL